MGTSLSRVSSRSQYDETNLQPVNELSHWHCLFRVVKYVQRLEVGMVGAVLELETNKVAELRSGATENLKRQGGSEVGCALRQPT